MGIKLKYTDQYCKVNGALKVSIINMFIDKQYRHVHTKQRDSLASHRQQQNFTG